MMTADAVSAHTAAEQREQQRDHPCDQRNGYGAGKQPSENSHGSAGDERAGESAQHGAQHSAHHQGKNENDGNILLNTLGGAAALSPAKP